MKRTALLLVILLVPLATGHTGENHSQQELEMDQHQQGDEFQFVDGDYPMETKYIVIAEIVLVSLLFIASLNHYMKREPEED